MTLSILHEADGLGAGDVDPLGAFVDLVVITNDTELGLDPIVDGLEPVTYTPSTTGAPQARLDVLVNTTWTPDYGDGPQTVDIIIIPALANFVLDDGTPLGQSFTNNGVALPPAGSGLGGDTLNPTVNCLVIYDTTQNLCLARAGTDGTLDLPTPNAVVLYHEFSHAFRILNNTLLQLTGICDPAAPEESAAITDENDLRTQIAERQGETPQLRDVNIHCGQVCPVDTPDTGCCIIASVASGSSKSPQVQSLRAVRDRFVRRTEVGHAFFERFFYDYYAFSPQVCTMIAGDPRLGRAILDGFVEPLLGFWQLVIARGFEGTDGEALARMLRAQHRDQAAIVATLAALAQTEAYWDLDESPADVPPALRSLLHERAWPSAHVQWALVEPVQIYRGVLRELADGASDTQLGVDLQAAIERWAPEFPLDPVWGELSRAELERELALWDARLLQSRAARRRLRTRLIDHFPHVTAIQQAAGS